MLIIIIQFTHVKINGYTSTKNFLLLVFLLFKEIPPTHLARWYLSLPKPWSLELELGWGGGGGWKGWSQILAQGKHFKIDYNGLFNLV